jgi:alpha-glucosidase
MKETSISKKYIQDPVGKKFWPFFKGRDGARTPMQWSTERYSGFSRKTPWLPLCNDFKKRNVLLQDLDQNSILNTYRRIIRLRKEYSCLQLGAISWQKTSSNLICFIRHDTKCCMRISINLSHHPQAMLAPEDPIVYTIGTVSGTYLAPRSAIVQQTPHPHVHS